MRGFEFLCLTPAGLTDPALAIAASRAGAVGILDLELTRDTAAAVAALADLQRLARNPFGVKLDGRRPGFARAILAALPEGARTVILTPGPDDEMPALVATARGRGARVLLEATGAEEATRAVAAGAEGLIAKGHEAAGRVAEETTFVLLQRLLRGPLPVWAQGGIGLHSAAAVAAGGAAGAVLDAQLYLTRESPLPRVVRDAIARMDGSETACVGGDLGQPWRVYARPGHRPYETLARAARELAAGGGAPEAAPGTTGATPVSAAAAWHETILESTGFSDPARRAWPLGQDAAFAATLAARCLNVAGILQAMRAAIEAHLAAARTTRALAPGGPLAASHGTEYPIVQGPMTRVSDTAAFAHEVALGGGLPFLALALLRAGEVRALLEETRARLGDRPWGIGILGFVPLELREEQLAAVRACPPPFALIAGGRPDQAAALERDGIATYLHVPSPGLLRQFVEGGARRLVFEGRECGGHVGPRTSFVLWNTMVDTLLDALPGDSLADCHILFAGGIHDARSAAMVAALAAPLSERGARIGVLLGTAYLFTREAVTSGAIMPGFQEAALGCQRTVLLETGPGHATRCVDSPFATAFERERRRLQAEGAPAEEIRNALEALNLGRLRVASKGVDRNPEYGRDPAAAKLLTIDAGGQREQGMFMIGQVAALHDQALPLAELHRDVSAGGAAFLDAIAPLVVETAPAAPARPSDVAIVGMASLLPGAPDLATFWRNILDKVDAVGEVPDDRWDSRLYFDPDRRARDRVYSKWGGFLADVAFDPMRYGITPNSLRSIEPVQLLLLDVVRAGLQDAGYLDRPFARQRTSVILGAGGGISDLGSLYTFRSLLPSFLQSPPEELMARLPEWTEDSFPGILLNVAAGRVANRFDLGGLNCTVDAACASSLAAIYMAVRELESGAADVAITGGIDTAQNPFMFLCFSKTHAHSPTGRCKTFDAAADGIAISEGIAVLVLKRLADAERDGDRIYAVIKAVAASSDGRDRGLTAPRPEGQILAVERAYAKAGFSPNTVGLVEAHGTGTVAGDQAEVTTLKRVFDAAGAGRQQCAIGSVKSMIGHTKCTAGVAGVQKVAMALHHGVLPPTLHVSNPNPKADFPASPFYVNSEARPWVVAPGAPPRRAGVSAFGFGGTNFHAVIEEYRDGIGAGEALTDAWPAELFVWRGRSREEIAADAARIEAALRDGAEPELADLARALWMRAAERDPAASRTLAIVAATRDDLLAKLGRARTHLASAADTLADPTGVHFAGTPYGHEGRVAFLFPGQGSQSVNMLRDLALRFPDVRAAFEDADAALAGRYPEALSRHIFPIPAFNPDDERAQQEALKATHVAQPALGAASLGALALLRRLGLRADMAAGHSYGEYAALAAAGVVDAATLAHLSERRGQAIRAAATGDLGTMAAAAAAPEAVQEALRGLEDVWIANYNAPRQTVVSGTRAGVDLAVEALTAAGIPARLLPVGCAFHSPVVAGARDRLAAELDQVAFAAPAFPVYSNSTAAPYPAEPAALRDLLAGHLVKPVRFTEEIQAMHQAGARVFVEVGPRNVLTGLAQQILADRPHVAVAIDQPGRNGVAALLGALAQLLAHGVTLDLTPLFEGRRLRRLNLAALADETRPVPLPPTTWMINGAYARPLHEDKRVPQPIAITGAAPPVAGPAAVADAIAPAPITPAAAAFAGAAPDLPLMAAIPALPAGADSDVALQFQRLMSQFLDTQRAVMQSYFAGGAPAPGVTMPVPAPADAQVARAATTSAASPVAAPIAPVAPAPVSVAATPAVPATPAVAATPARAVAPVAPGSPAGSSRDAILQRLVVIAADRTGYPTDMIAPGADIEADLGIDSIKRVEILGALQRDLPAGGAAGLQAAMESLTRARSLGAIADLAAAAIGATTSPGVTPGAAPGTAPATAAQAAIVAAVAGPSRDEVLTQLVAIAAERTGYPPDMIAADADIEADLGIDSIKRVEILGALQRNLPAGVTAQLQAAMESLTRARSLGAIAALAAAAIGAPAASGPPATAQPGTAPTTATAPAATAPAAPSAATVAGPSPDEILKRLVAIAAERTGYPPDMIAADADIEADLGIDSIKRVEILGALQRNLPAGVTAQLQAAMESLTRARSLGAIAALAAAAIGAPAASAAPVASATPAARPATAAPAEPAPAAPAAAAPLARYLLRAVESAPVADGTRRMALRGARIVITDDERGIAAALADLLRERGAETYMLRAATVTGVMPPDAAPAADDRVDLADPAAVTAALAQIQETAGALTGVIHLLPLRGPATFAPGDLDPFRRRVALEVKGLFHLVRAARADLRAAGERGFVVAATGMGGEFGLRPGTALFPAGGGVAGFAKTLALEWPALRCKAIDLDPGAAAAGLAAGLLGEMLAGDPEVEVGLRDGRRLVVRPVTAPLGPAGGAAPAGGDRPPLGPDAVVLVTGGARGITAEVTVELALRHRPTFVVVGRSPEPPAREAPGTASLATPAELRPALLASLRAAGGAVTPATVDRALGRLMQERDTRRGLAALRAAGSQARYFACDVRDPRAVGALLDRLYTEHGRIDGVVHGAGLIEDHLIEDKDPESFARVFDTKVDSTFVLLSRLRLDHLRVFVAFTSVAGRFGNRGQADYAAANETVARMLGAADPLTPARLAGLHWGPWQKTGMASAEVQRAFAERGVELVTPEAGRRAGADEVARGRKGEVEVILGDGPWRAYTVLAETAAPPPATAPTGPAAAPSRSVVGAPRTAPRPATGRLPLVDGETLASGPGGAIELVRRLDPARDLYLADHLLDGRPVFPAACAMELMAEVAQRGWPEYQVLEIEAFRVVKGIVLDAGARSVKVIARAETQPDPERLGVSADLSIVDPETGRPFYRASVRLGDRLPEPPALGFGALRAPRPFPKTVRGAYEEWLFHGPLFHGLTSIEGWGDDGISGVIVPSDPGRCVAGAQGSGWLIDPVVVDSAFQLGILYARAQYDVTPLPARFRRYRRFAPLDRAAIRCEFRSRAIAGPSVLEIQIALVGPDGRLLGLLEDMELSCSRDLNRLAGRSAAGPAR